MDISVRAFARYDLTVSHLASYHGLMTKEAEDIASECEFSRHGTAKLPNGVEIHYDKSSGIWVVIVR